MKKHISIIALAIVIAGLLSLAGCAKKEKSNTGGVPEVAVAEAMTDSVVLHKDYPGYLQANLKAEVVGEVSGRLLTKNFESGQYVTKGQVLFTIESTRYRDAVEQAEASLISARSQRDFYSRQTDAMTRALADGAVSQMEMLQSKNSLNQANASIRNANAQLETARTNLAKCTVRAPISGYITIEEISVGNYINGEGNPQTLATIYDNSVFNALFSVSDDSFREMLSNPSAAEKTMLKAVPLKFELPTKTAFTADLYYEAPSVNQSTGALQLVGRVKNVENELKDGMYVTISLPYGVDPKAVVVKDASLSTDQLGKYLYVVNDSDKVVYRPVETGQLYRDSLRVITKGLKPGERYVTEALLTVRPGMEVKPVAAK